MYTATAQQLVAADIAAVWQSLTSGENLAQWFADSADLRAGSACRFSFGDGDFFAGFVRGWDPPHELRWSWQFMGVGPTFDIHFVLEAVDRDTLVTVTDSGAITASEAESLTEGWRDFLGRLADHTATGRRTRYVWSETITAGVLLPRDAPAARDLLSLAWLRLHFPDATVDAAELNGEVHLTFRDPVWNGITTSARMRVTPLAESVHVGFAHSGWTALPPEQRFDQRRRYAGLWHEGLRDLEIAYAASA